MIEEIGTGFLSSYPPALAYSMGCHSQKVTVIVHVSFNLILVTVKVVVIIISNDTLGAIK